MLPKENSEHWEKEMGPLAITGMVSSFPRWTTKTSMNSLIIKAKVAVYR